MAPRVVALIERHPKRWVAASVVALCLAWPAAAQAWIYAEHASISEGAIERLSPEALAFYDELWKTAAPPRACATLTLAQQTTRPTCIDFAAWAAIAGDH